MNKIKIQLEYPIRAHGKEVTELAFPARCKARHMRGLTANPTIDEILDKLANLAQIPPSSINDVDKVDVMTLIEFYSNFFDMPDASEITPSFSE